MTTVRTRILALAALFALVAAPVLATDPVNKTFFGGVAIDGYDPVAYFTDGRPVEGRKAFQHEWNGAVWRFASAEHRDLFAAQPETYAPQYGGYCAWAVSQGYTADIDPDAWTIRDDKLYLNYSLDIQEKWLADVEKRIEEGDAKWPKILAE